MTATTLPATQTQTKSATLTPALPLPDNLAALLMGSESPIVGPDDAKQLAEFAATPEPEAAAKAQVEVMIAKLAMATAQSKVSEAEASERMDAYWLALSDIPLDDLRAAYVALVRTCKFLPTPAEVRIAALNAGSGRKYAKSRARFLAWKHSVEWRPPVEVIPADEVAALLSGVSLAAES